MRKFLLLLAVLALQLTFLFQADPAHAQAPRTWVSGVGDDANPCSRTAPCKTFAGMISKTATGGEINCIDPGGFGALTIVKAITIDCSNTEAGVLVAGTNGIVVSAGAGDVVTLRGLDFFGTGTASTVSCSIPARHRSSRNAPSAVSRRRAMDTESCFSRPLRAYCMSPIHRSPTTAVVRRAVGS
jgi:hypothetical protein